jgi:hypothetical protein
MVSAAVEVARCYACGEEKPLDEFYPDSSKASGRMSRCRACDLEKGRRYYRANRDRILARHERAAPREAVCPGCGEPFVATNGRQVYCKPGCRPTGDRGAKVTVPCAWCGREFEARARDRARRGGRFCCKSHALQARNSPAVAAVTRGGGRLSGGDSRRVTAATSREKKTPEARPGTRR